LTLKRMDLLIHRLLSFKDILVRAVGPR